jgi:hypothetical protein
MGILFDQGTPAPLRRFLREHVVTTAYEEGWSELSNGLLLSAAEDAGFELLITTDGHIRYQQNLSKRIIAIIVLPTTQWPEIRDHVSDVKKAVDETAPGTFRELNW